MSTACAGDRSIWPPLRPRYSATWSSIYQKPAVTSTRFWTHQSRGRGLLVVQAQIARHGCMRRWRRFHHASAALFTSSLLKSSRTNGSSSGLRQWHVAEIPLRSCSRTSSICLALWLPTLPLARRDLRWRNLRYVYTRMYVYIYICMYVCIYVHVHMVVPFLVWYS